ncbi:uncharacterized protein V6R79_009437 [Siganus canaliculatus]
MEKMKSVFSTLRGFNMLTITEYRVGSIIAYFQMVIARDIQSEKLNEKLNILSQNLNASFYLKTEGVATLSTPPTVACYNSQKELDCTVKEDLNAEPEWKLRRKNEVFEIFDGTEATVTSEPKKTTVELKNLTELWAGEYTCVFRQREGNNVILHQASVLLDISPLPKIHIYTEPSFPHCKQPSDEVNVRVQCDIDSSGESYTVNWTHTDVKRAIESPEEKVYAVETLVSCQPGLKPQITCTFQNRCNQTRSASVDINIIFGGEPFCEAEGDWPDAKANFTAVLKCKDSVGTRERKCEKISEKAIWKPEVSDCVNPKVHNLKQKAIIADVGLGALNENAAIVFDRLEKVTNNTQNINTFADLRTSVQIIEVLSVKNLQLNESASGDFLETSSNLLEDNLSKSWETPSNSNSSLAATYLISVEHLMQKSNFSSTKKKNIEVAVQNCSESQCTNTVFDAQVNLNVPNPSSVKMAAFKELDKYLPRVNDSYEPNSIVVSATTEKRQLDGVEVKIHFPLLKPRPPNVLMQCVFWDDKTDSWSEEGCRWEGPEKEGACVCTHLSSFAILMSKYPLEVPLLSEITTAGLSISVVSLVISLIIELIVWNAVVKTKTLYLRHTAYVNICVCLLVANCSFLASSKPHAISALWCKAFVVLKHFCYLAMFFWMMCMSITLLHQAVFLFHNVSKKIYLRISFAVGYVCPLLIVTITFLTNSGGAEGAYFSRKTCWLIYSGLMQGSIYTFIIPVGVIVFINVFSMVVVIMKLLEQPSSAETSDSKEKKAAKTVLRTIVLLTPVFGVTWIFGFAVMTMDLASGIMSLIVNYTFSLTNSLQGLFILLTMCLGDKLTREALLKTFTKRRASATTSNSTSKFDLSGKQ